MKKRCLCLVLFALFLLSGCCLSHEWQAATCAAPETCSKCGETLGVALGHEWVTACTEPETCSVCGETRGEAPGHDWTAATCTAAETCSVCGETQGEVSEHTWAAANFQQPERCDVCGEENGEPLTTEPVDVGADSIWKIVNYYVVPCTGDSEKITVGTVETLIGRIQDGMLGASVAELVEAMGITPREDYALVMFGTEFLFDDENAYTYGVDCFGCANDVFIGDYYTHTMTVQENSDLPLFGVLPFNEDGFYVPKEYVVNVNGEEMPAYSFVFNGADLFYEGGFAYTEYFFYIPKGYDGTVVGLHNAAKQESGGVYSFSKMDDNSVYYRLTF